MPEPIGNLLDMVNLAALPRSCVPFTAQKMKFSIRISSVNVTTFTEEILNR